ncbi:hypothetical protein QFC21_006694 [Naganishia friedmannii]|uniref:Uncharacterized protein n=1 Tax=Naganishia friedmannii TaxID=89922 RepID=A0ACC2V153_9TREE|nr:hypothetical protein QFC21_006694 [Naganishia friedmannii]
MVFCICYDCVLIPPRPVEILQPRKLFIHLSSNYGYQLFLVSFPAYPLRSNTLLTLASAGSTDTGYFEEAQYRFTSNATNPKCITAYILWQHGKFELNDSGSMTLYPFPSDGRIQVQDPCAAVTNLITEYNQQTLYADWGITMDSTRGNYKLQLNRFDGAKMPPMWLMANPPNMLPTQYLTGVNASGQAA